MDTKPRVKTSSFMINNSPPLTKGEIIKKVFQAIFVITIGLGLLALPIACSGKNPFSKQTYKEKLLTARHKVGEVIIVDEGFYKGCHLKVTKVEPHYSEIIYRGTSEDCPIAGVSDTGVYHE